MTTGSTDKFGILVSTSDEDNLEYKPDKEIILDGDYNVYVSNLSYSSDKTVKRKISLQVDDPLTDKITIVFDDNVNISVTINNLNDAIHNYFYNVKSYLNHTLPFFFCQKRKKFGPRNVLPISMKLIHLNPTFANLKNIPAWGEGMRFQFIKESSMFLTRLGFNIDALNRFCRNANLDETCETFLEYELSPRTSILYVDFCDEPLCLLPNTMDFIAMDSSYNVQVKKRKITEMKFTLKDIKTNVQIYKNFYLACTLIFIRRDLATKSSVKENYYIPYKYDPDKPMGVEKPIGLTDWKNTPSKEELQIYKALQEPFTRLDVNDEVGLNHAFLERWTRWMNRLKEQLPTEQLPLELLPTKQLPPEPIPTKQLPPEPLPSQKLPTQKLPTQKVSTQKVSTQKIHAETSPSEPLINMKPNQQKVISTAKEPKSEATIKNIPPKTDVSKIQKSIVSASEKPSTSKPHEQIDPKLLSEPITPSPPNPPIVDNIKAVTPPVEINVQTSVTKTEIDTARPKSEVIEPKPGTSQVKHTDKVKEYNPLGD